MKIYKSICKYKLTRNSIFFLLCIFIVSCSDNPKDNKVVVNNSIEQLDSLNRNNPKFLKEQELENYVLTSPTIKPNGNLNTPFDTLSYDKIIAYDFEGREEPYPSVLDRNLKFVPVILNQKALTKKQAYKILSTLSSNSTYGKGTSACFIPHLGLLFFKDNKVKNVINICLDCNYLISDITIPAETHLEFINGKKSEYETMGFTMSGKKAIIDFCKDLNFYYGRIKNK